MAISPFKLNEDSASVRMKGIKSIVLVINGASSLNSPSISAKIRVLFSFPIFGFLSATFSD